MKSIVQSMKIFLGYFQNIICIQYEVKSLQI